MSPRRPVWVGRQEETHDKVSDCLEPSGRPRPAVERRRGWGGRSTQVWTLSCDDCSLHTTWEFTSQTSPEAGMRPELGSVTTTCPGFPGRIRGRESCYIHLRRFLLLCPFGVCHHRCLGLRRCCHTLWDRHAVLCHRAQLLPVDSMLRGVQSFNWKVGERSAISEEKMLGTRMKSPHESQS